ncbi:TRZ/ATZ family hydrolase [Pleionea sediminis]|uniref:TRZ/ATZ family hydrolase n=1 Tax=Pleionea sediminis TaxID=2569479 RepID=UPI0011871743|nr:TRZ/ATZ family hydrolase [Pleionea sediminis]
MTQPIDSLIFSRWLAPVNANQTVHEHFGVAIDKGKIVALDSQETLQQKFVAKNTYDLSDHLLVPGFVNSHTHAAMNLLKGYSDDLPLMEWLQNHIWPAEAKLMSDEFVYQGTQLAIAEMIKSGTTCFNDMYFMPNKAAQAAINHSMRAVIGLTIIEFPTAWAKDAEEYLHKGLAVYDEFKGENLVSFSLAPHAPYTVSDETLQKIATLSNQLDIGIHMHVHETEHEVNESIDKHGERPLARLHQLGLLSPSFQAVHMTSINDDDLKLVKDNGVHVMHCPESNMKLASGFSPIAQFQRSNINIALGTDGCASNNDLDMIGEMRSAALLAKVTAGDASCFSAHDALHAATLGGAKALGLESVCGSIEVGKAADLCAINLNHIATQPVTDPVSQLVYAASRDQVSHVWTSGKLQLNDGEFTDIQYNDLLNIIEHWQARMRKELNH